MQGKLSSNGLHKEFPALRSALAARVSLLQMSSFMTCNVNGSCNTSLCSAWVPVYVHNAQIDYATTVQA